MVTSGLVGFWPLSEWSGRANDLSGNDNHGTLNGGVSQGVAGKSGLTAHGFNGSDGYISLGTGSELHPEDALTASVWVYNNDVNTTQEIFSYRLDGDPYRIWAIADEWAQFYVDDGTSNGSNILFGNYSGRENMWEHHVFVFSRERQTAERYINGELDDSVDIGGDYPLIDPGFNGTTDQGAFIGAARSDLRHADVVLSDARLYNRALSPSEIQHLYEIGSVDVATPPAEADSAAVSRWSFDDRSDTSTALDEWGSNDGTINGATYSADSIRGLSMEFEKDNGDYIDTNNNFGFDSTTSFSVSVWLNPESTATQTVLGRYDGADDVLQFFYNGDLSFQVGHAGGNDQQPTFTNLNTDAWYHAVGVFDSSVPETSLYINGTLVDVDSGTLDEFAEGSNWRIGDRGGTTQNSFDGGLDDVRIYSRVLSDYEVQQLYLWGTRGTDRRYEVLRQ